MKKILSITLTVTTTCWLVGVAMFAPVASGATILEGDIVSPDATYTDDDGNTYYTYDVFIIKYMGDKKFKRLVLNPEVFESYGHLEWSNIKTVTVSEVEAFASADAVRADGDEKVYKLFPDGDTGIKRWVETLDCFNSKNYDWDSVYTINSVDRDNYTTGATMCGEVVDGDMTLSLASTTPAAATIPPDAQGVDFLKVNVAGSGIINQITIKRLGAGAVGDFDELYIYQNDVRLTSGRSLSSATSKVTFINLGLAAPTTFSVVADMGTSGAGNVNYLAIEASSDVTSDATVGGTFPIAGNPMGNSSTTIGTLTVTRSGTGSRNVTIGATGVEISQFKVEVANEGTNLERIHLFNTGDVTNTKITNLKLKDNTLTTVATADAIGDDGYVAFVFDSLYYIKKGDSEIFRVFADIGGVKPDRTIKLYMELSTDILGKGTTYGFGMNATVTGFDGTDSTEYVTATCKGGDLTLNKVGPYATNIGTDTDDTVFLEYTISAAADITIRRTELIFCHDNSGGSSYQDASVSAGADITDIKIVDKDTGTVIVGPKDGTAFNDTGTVTASDETGYQSCPSSKNGVSEAFTDTFDISAGEQRTFQVTADVDVSATDDGIELTTTDVVKFVLYSYASMVGGSGNVNRMKYTGTTDAVDDSAIVPSGDIAGEEMTIAAPSLALTLAASPSGSDGDSDEKVYIKGHTGAEAVGIIFTAGESSDITVDSISLISYTTLDSGGDFVAGVADGHSVKDSIGSVYIYDTTTGALIPGSSAKGFTSGTDSEYVDYTGLSWTIPAGEDRTMLVKTDISSASPASGSGDADLWIAFDIETAATHVSAVDKDGNSITVTNDGPNGGVSTNTDFGIADYGSITIAAATDTPDKSLLVMGTDDNEVSKFKLSGSLEAWNIEKFAIGLYDGNADATNAEKNDRDNFTGVALKYQTEAQWGSEDWTISSKKTFGATASLAFNFSGSDRIYIPKDDDTYLSVLVDVKGYLGGTGGKSKVPVMINHSTSETTGFKAYGAQSGRQETSLTAVVNSSFNLHFVTRSKPIFAKGAWSSAELELARFTITAVGYDVIFDGTAGTEDDIASACLKFDLIASSSDNGLTGDLFLYDWNETIVASNQTVSWGTGGGVASVTFAFEEDDVTVPGGTTKEFHIDLGPADVTDFVKTDEYIYLQLRNDDGGDLATGSMGFGERDIVWHDGTAEEGITTVDGDASAESRFGMPGLIKNVGPLPITFRTLRGTGAP